MTAKWSNTRFGGIIYPSDFNTDYRGNSDTNGSKIANRIANDRRFDEQCKKTAQERLISKKSCKQEVRDPAAGSGASKLKRPKERGI